MSKDKQEKLLVNAPLQKRLLWPVVGILAAYHVVLWHILFLFHLMAYQVDVLNGEKELSLASAYVDYCVESVPMFLAVCAVLPLFARIAIKHTHRLADPLASVTNALSEIRDGKRVEPISFQKKDLLDEFQAEFNEFLEWYNLKHGVTPDVEVVAGPIPEDVVPLGEATVSAEAPLEENVLEDLDELKKTTEGIRVTDEETQPDNPEQPTEPQVGN